jgi:hypothetical protein
MSETLPPEIEPQWCLVANVRKFNRKGEGGQEIIQGTRHFSGGTKVYCFPALWGDGYEQIRVIGKHRGSPKLVVMILHWRYLTNWRAKLIYEPRVLALLQIGDRPAWSRYGHDNPRELVEQYAAAMRERESYLPPLDDLTGMEPSLPKVAAQIPSLGGEALVSHLQNLLSDDDRKVRFRVVCSIQRLQLVQAAPLLIALLDTEPVEYIQQEAITALDSFGTEEAVKAAALWRKRQQIRRAWGFDIHFWRFLPSAIRHLLSANRHL